MAARPKIKLTSTARREAPIRTLRTMSIRKNRSLYPKPTDARGLWSEGSRFWPDGAALSPKRCLSPFGRSRDLHFVGDGIASDLKFGPARPARSRIAPRARSRRQRLDEISSDCEGESLGAPAYQETSTEGRKVLVHGVGRDRQAAGDHGRGQPFCKEKQTLLLAWAERRLIHRAIPYRAALRARSE
jgi:hypothetical protein